MNVESARSGFVIVSRFTIWMPSAALEDEEPVRDAGRRSDIDGRGEGERAQRVLRRVAGRGGQIGGQGERGVCHARELGMGSGGDEQCGSERSHKCVDSQTVERFVHPTASAALRQRTPPSQHASGGSAFAEYHIIRRAHFEVGAGKRISISWADCAWKKRGVPQRSMSRPLASKAG